MKIDEGKILLLLTGMLSGIVLVSFLLNTKLSPTIFLSYSDYQQKKSEHSNLATEINSLRKNLAIIENKLDEYHSDQDKDKVINESMKDELYKLKLEFGATEVSGPGIVVVLDDRKYYLNDFEAQLQENLIHNYDIMNIVQDLVNAGAEAISINGIRYVNNMAITCVGPIIGLKVGDEEEVISPKFIIEVIGDPQVLSDYLNSSESWYQVLKFRKLPISIEKKDNIKIQASKIGNASGLFKIKQVK